MRDSDETPSVDAEDDLELLNSKFPNLDVYGDRVSRNQVREALKVAHDTRKFEIDLYWKRAAYFWAFSAAAFAGYFVLLKDGVSDDLRFVVCCLGFIFALSWYLVNRGSKFWQLNWETHVDILEDAITGPLYKTVLDPAQFHAKQFTQPYAFSVTRVNIALSFFVGAVWIFLAIYSLTRARGWAEPFTGFNILILLLMTMAAAWGLLQKGKSDLTKPQDRQLRRRKICASLSSALPSKSEEP